MKIASVILAAGKGERMVSRLPKVLHRVMGMPMLFYPLKVLEELGVERRIVIVGHGKEEVCRFFEGERLEFVEQNEQLGTAHAMLMTEGLLKNWDGGMLVLSGDVPLIRVDTLRGLVNLHKSGGANLTILTTEMDEPAGYGRVIRDGDGDVIRIVEEADASSEEREVKEINAGIYCISSLPIFDVLRDIRPSKVKGEYYLTDMVEEVASRGYRVCAYKHHNPFEVMGVNTREALAQANRVMRRGILKRLMDSGVTFIDPENTFIDYGVSIGMDTIIYPNVHIEGKSRIGEGCVIEEGCKIIDSTLGNGTKVRSSTVVESSTVGESAIIGPFARLRPGNNIGNNVRIGNFVEVKNSTMKDGTKANHLSYIGDAIIGKNVNIGAGTITCNYDGREKYQTIIEDGAFIGSDTQLVAPVRVGKGAYIGSGSTITKDVPPGALALSRVEQKNIEGWVERRWKKED